MDGRYLRDCVVRPVALFRLRRRAMLLPVALLRQVAHDDGYGSRAVARAVLRRTPWAW
jgi:hypothetical protein